MQVKRYKAADMRRALELVRSDLGDDAVILSSANTSKGVEILATADDCQQLLNSANAPEPLAEEKINVFAKYELAAEQENLALMSDLELENRDIQRHTSDRASKAELAKKERSYLAEQLEKLTAHVSFPQPSQARQNQGFKQPAKVRGSIEIVEDSEFSTQVETAVIKPTVAAVKVAVPRPVDEQDLHSKQQIEQLQSELADMRELLEMQLTQTRFANLRGLQLACDRRLEQMGFGLQFRSDFHSHCDLSRETQQDAAWRATIGYLTNQVRTLDYDLIRAGGQLALIGPTGAGKTTTIAKLATRYVLTQGRESIALVTVDNERLGSQSQLKSLAKILQIPLRTVANPEDLNDTLASLDYCRLVLIDTPGVTALGLNENPFVRQLFAMPEVTKLVVLACNAQRRFQQNLLAALADKNVRAAVLTKLDETECLAETLDAVVAAGLPVAYTTDGQHIPDDLAVAKSHQLVSGAVKALQKNKRKSASTDADDALQRQSA